MPAVPSPGEYTVCEISREFLTCKDQTDSHAQDEYSKILGMTYPPIPFRIQPDVSMQSADDQMPELEPVTEEAATDAVEQASFIKKVLAVKNHFSVLFQRLIPQLEKICVERIKNFQAVSWHKHKHFLAFIAGNDQVMVYDFEDRDTSDPYILSNESQKDVEAVEWRPNSGAAVGVACRDGIAIWMASYPGSIAPVRSNVASLLGPHTKVASARWILADFLRSPSGAPITALSWSPCGRFLASASIEGSAFCVWDVSLGEATPLRRGLGGISLLKWSTTGDYLLTTKHNGMFNFWETTTWTSEPWSSAGGCITSAMWSPDGRVLLCAFDRTTTLGTLHFAGRPPSLDVHLLPLDLPEIDAITGSHGTIDKIAWDGTGERLAVSYNGGDATYAGLIAIYDTRKSPIISASLLGFIRGPGKETKPVAFSFHNKLKQGALLAVCWSSGYCCVYPFLFKAH